VTHFETQDFFRRLASMKMAWRAEPIRFGTRPIVHGDISRLQNAADGKKLSLTGIACSISRTRSDALRLPSG